MKIAAAAAVTLLAATLAAGCGQPDAPPQEWDEYRYRFANGAVLPCPEIVELYHKGGAVPVADAAGLPPAPPPATTATNARPRAQAGQDAYRTCTYPY